MTLFSKETISSQTPFLKMILYLMILIKKSRKRPCDRLPGQPKGRVGSIPIRFHNVENIYDNVKNLYDNVENIHDNAESKLHLHQIRKTSGCIPKAN